MNPTDTTTLGTPLVLLISSHEEEHRKAESQLGRENIPMVGAVSCEQGLDHLSRHPVTVVLYSSDLPGTSPKAMAGLIRQRRPSVVPIGIARPTLFENCSYKEGEELVQPLLPVRWKAEWLIDSVRLAHGEHLRREAEARAELEGAPDSRSRSEPPPPNPSALVGQGPAMQRLRIQVREACLVERVLLLGEAGTGKGEVAREIHRLSARKGAFVTVNGAALTDSVVESTLFGHEKGSFSGAIAKKIGLVEQAHEGTLFIDEVGSMTLAAQGSLLDVLQRERFKRLGGTIELESKMAVLAATNRDLKRMVKEGTFLGDLYARLKTMIITTPGMADRREDVPELVNAILDRLTTKRNRPRVQIAAEAMALLVITVVPDEVRGLMSAVERMQAKALLANGVITEQIAQAVLDELAIESVALKSLPTLAAQVDLATTRAVMDALAVADNNQTEAARLLQTSPRVIRGVTRAVFGGLDAPVLS